MRWANLGWVTLALRLLSEGVDFPVLIPIGFCAMGLGVIYCSFLWESMGGVGRRWARELKVRGDAVGMLSGLFAKF